MRWLLNKLGVHDQKELMEFFWQFVKFGMVGISNTIVSMAIYYLFLWFDESLFMLGSVLGTIVSIANAFVWNDLFVFTGNPKNFKSVVKRLARTYISYGGTSLLSNVLLWLEVVFLHVNKIYAPIVNLLITIPLNFMINKCWTFKR